MTNPATVYELSTVLDRVHGQLVLDAGTLGTSPRSVAESEMAEHLVNQTFTQFKQRGIGVTARQLDLIAYNLEQDYLLKKDHSEPLLKQQGLRIKAVLDAVRATRLQLDPVTPITKPAPPAPAKTPAIAFTSTPTPAVSKAPLQPRPKPARKPDPAPKAGSRDFEAAWNQVAEFCGDYDIEKNALLGMIAASPREALALSPKAFQEGLAGAYDMSRWIELEMEAGSHLDRLEATYAAYQQARNAQSPARDS